MLGLAAASTSWLVQLGPLAMGSAACAAARLAISCVVHQPQPRPYSTQLPSLHSLAACVDEASLQVAAGSTWPTAPKQALEAVAEELPGLWLFVACGSWAAGTPQAGRPAHALLHTLLYTMDDRGHPVPVLHQHNLGGCYYYHSVYGLDSNGWPSGVLYPSPLWFEAQTTNRSQGKPASSIKHMVNGKHGLSLGTWAKRVLKSEGAVLIPRARTHRLQEWYHTTVADVGIQVLDNTAEGP